MWGAVTVQVKPTTKQEEKGEVGSVGSSNWAVAQCVTQYRHDCSLNVYSALSSLNLSRFADVFQTPNYVCGAGVSYPLKS